jgi:hypothetical protein
MAWPNASQLGPARPRAARRGPAQHGMAWHSAAQHAPTTTCCGLRRPKGLTHHKPPRFTVCCSWVHPAITMHHRTNTEQRQHANPTNWPHLLARPQQLSCSCVWYIRRRRQLKQRRPQAFLHSLQMCFATEQNPHQVTSIAAKGIGRRKQGTRGCDNNQGSVMPETLSPAFAMLRHQC